MGIFGRKKKKEEPKFPPGQVDVQPPQPPQLPQNQAQPRPNFPQATLPTPAFPPVMPVQAINAPAKNQSVEDAGRPPATAPLFVKLTRYRHILDNMENIKTGLGLVRNQIAILNEIEKLRTRNMKVLESTMEKLSKRLIKLDAEFTRPAGFVEETPEMQIEEMESLESTITDLKEEIEGLKQEVDALS